TAVASNKQRFIYAATSGARSERSRPTGATHKQASWNDFEQSTECAVHCARVGERCGDVGVENDDVATLADPSGILASDSAPEVVFLPHLIHPTAVSPLPHRCSALPAWHAEH